MSKYNINIYGNCKDFLDDLKKNNLIIYNQIYDTINEIISNPFKSKFKRLESSDKDRRARSGDFRIVFFVEGDSIFITKIDQRKNVYRSSIGCPKMTKKKLKSL